MILLAGHSLKSSRPLSIRLIADELGIPFHFLVKILHRLTKGGMLESTRGAGGGVRLTRPASSINLTEVLLMLGEDNQLQGCVLSSGGFCADHPCPLHEEWKIEAGRIKNLFAETRLDKLAKRVLDGAGCPTCMPALLGHASPEHV